ncbi:hypothetical protein ACFQ22_01715 [Lentilactobacillus raoultii]|uniref:Uncharacterized protein n=1 Tax=Lentilactobacillus raoultii TaxID=1987503 RepID=A0ABW3PP48_9LACO|nr:hypothetical protein [Lentilactobacillus raoultii]
MNSDKEIIDRVNKIMRQYGSPFIDGSRQLLEKFGENNQKTASDFLISFLIAMVSASVHPIPQLTEEDIMVTVGAIDTALPTDVETNELFDEIVQTGYLFLWSLAGQGDIELTPGQVTKAFGAVTDYQPMFSDFDELEDMDDFDEVDPDDPDWEIYHYERPDLPEYRVTTANRIRATALDLAEKLVDSGQLKPIVGKVSELYEDDVIFNLVGVVSHLYGEYRRTPSRWTKKALKGVLTGYLVKDASIRPVEYSQVGAILKTFMTFAAKNRFVSEKIAERMKRAIDEIEPKMIQLGSDKQNFSEDKRDWLANTNANHFMKEDDDQFSDVSDDQLFDNSASDNASSSTKPGSEGRVISLSKWKKQNKKKKKRKPKKR